MKITLLEDEVLTEAQRHLLDERAERVRQVPAAEQTEQQVWLAEFQLGPETFALPLESLRTAIPLRGVTPVPLAPPQVLGVLRHAGRTMTAYSLSALLGGRGWSQDPSVLLILDRPGGALVAVDCERVPRAVALPQATVEAAREGASGAVIPLLTPGRQFVHLIDVERLLPSRAARS